MFQNKFSTIIGQLSIVAGIGLIAILVTNFLVIKQNEAHPPLATAPILKCPTDYASFASTTKKVTLLDNKISNGSGNVLKGYRVTLERTGLTSDIACGYLMYKISFNNRPVEQDFMSLFMRPMGSQFGGHLLPDEKKGAIVQEIDGKTQVLMPLSVITYDGITRQTIKEANWAALMNVADKMDFEIALSADTTKGNIDTVEFAYKCINKDSGKESEVCEIKVTGVEAITI